MTEQACSEQGSGLGGNVPLPAVLALMDTAVKRALFQVVWSKQRSTNISAVIFIYGLKRTPSPSESAEDSSALLKASTQNEANGAAMMPNGHIKRGH